MYHSSETGDLRRLKIDSKLNMGHEYEVVQAVVSYFSNPRFKRFSTEEEYPVQMGSYRGRADVALLDRAGKVAAIIECKKSGYEGDGHDQLKSYLNAKGTPMGVFANETDPAAWTFYENRGAGQFNEIDRSRFEAQLKGNVIKRLADSVRSFFQKPDASPPHEPIVITDPDNIIGIKGALSVQNGNHADFDLSLNGEPYYSEQNGFFWARAHRGLVSLLPQHIERIIYGTVQNDDTNSYHEQKQLLETGEAQLDAEKKTCEDKLTEKKQDLAQMDREQARLGIEIGALPDKEAPTEPEVHRVGWSIFNKIIAIGMTFVLLTLIFYLFIFYASACDKAFFLDVTKLKGISDIVNPFAIFDALTGRWNFFVVLCPIVFLATALALHYFGEKAHWGRFALGGVIFFLDVMLAFRISRSIHKGNVRIGVAEGEWVFRWDDLSIWLVILFGFGVALLCSVIYHIFWHQWKEILNPTEDEMGERRRQQEERRVQRVEKESQRAVNAITQDSLQQEINGFTEELSSIQRRSDQMQGHIETLLGRGNVRVINYSLLRSQVNEFLVGWCQYVVHHGGDRDEIAQINQTVEATIDRFYKAHGAEYHRANSVQEAR